MIFFILTGTVLTFILYQRYFPVFGVHLMNLKDLDLDRVKVIDIRDFNESHNNMIEGALNIPIAYLSRYCNEIPKRELHLVVANLLEKNIGARFLRKKGYRVVGYTIINQDHLSFKKSPLKTETNC